MKSLVCVAAAFVLLFAANEASATGAFQRQVVVRRQVVHQPVQVVRQVVRQPVVVQQVHANAGCFGAASYGQQFAVGSCGVNAFSGGYGNAFGVNQFGYGGVNAFGFQRQRFVGNRLVSPFGLNRGLFGFGRGLSLNFGF